MLNQQEPQPASAGSPSTLDPVALGRLAELDPTGQSRLIERVLGAFQTSAARLGPQLEEARRAGDRNTIRLVAHTLKSSSASIGAMQLSQWCAQVEAAVREGAGAADLQAPLDSLEASLEAALQAIGAMLKERA